MRKQKIAISVIGGHDSNDELDNLAHNIGEIVADVGGVLVCGGLGGAMEASCKGAKKRGGLTIGLLPGKEKSDANPYVDIALPTSIGYARNACVACSADIIVALPGSHGTNCEILYGLVYGRPVIDLGGWGIEGMIKAKDIGEAREIIERLVEKLNKNCDDDK